MIKLPKTREEYTLFALEYKQLDHPFTMEYHDVCINRKNPIHPKVIGHNLKTWIDRTQDRFPDLYVKKHAEPDVVVEHGNHHNIYIAGVWVTTIWA